jgi:MinD-like ATPase involved in chromosome partitioning or flagellar assembly
VTQVVVVGSVKGTGGVSTTALLLAAGLGESADVVLVEADPSGGSLLGWCEQLSTVPGSLYDVVFDHDRSWSLVRQSLGEIGVVVAQGDPWRISVALERPRSWRAMFDRLDAAVVVVDVGRLFPGSPAWSVVGAADRLVLVAPSEAGALAATWEWMGRGGQHTATDAPFSPDRMRVVTVDVSPRSVLRLDPGRVRELGDRYVGHVPHDPAGVGLICRGAALAHRSVRRSRLVPAARQLAAALVPAAWQVV